MAGHLDSTVDELQARMGSAEFTEWKAYARREPIGEEREDLRWALLAAEIARGPAEEPATAQDFFERMRFWHTVKKQTPEEQIAIYKARKATYGNHNRKT